MKLEHVPKSARGPFERAHRSRASAMKAMCLECMGFDRKSIGACQSRDCPLWAWRPFQEPKRPRRGVSGDTEALNG